MKANIGISRVLPVLFLSILCLAPIKAQKKQFYVKLNGDTIQGKLAINTYEDNSRKMQFKTADGERVTLIPQLAKYVYHSPKYQYGAVPYRNMRLFMEIVHVGSLSVFNYVRFDKNMGRTITSKILLRGNSALEISRIGFRKSVVNFLDGCPSLQQQVSTREYKSTDLVEIAQAYEECSLTTSGTQLSARTKFKDFAGAIRNTQDLEGKKDILEIIKDIQRRVSANDEIPEYMWKALIGSLGHAPNLQSLAMQIKGEL